MASDDVRIGVLQADLSLPGARSLKHTRQVLRSIRDRVRHRFAVSCHELPLGDRPGRGGLVITTGGEAAGVIRQTLDRIAGLLRSHPAVVVVQLDTEVFPWHGTGQEWADLVDPLPTEDDDG
jgi:uncharacterized protein YlxP (DUF503 family)